MKPGSKIDILFLDGLEPITTKPFSSFLNYLFPLAAELQKKQITFKILHLATLSEYSMEALVEELQNHCIETIGMTTNIDNICMVYNIADRIKEELPELRIVLGGSQASYNDNYILQKCKADFILRKEADYSLPILLDTFKHKDHNITRVPGLTYRDEKGTICRTPDQDAIDLNELSPPLFSIISDSSYWLIPQNTCIENFPEFLKKIQVSNSIYLTGRGCPYKCKFCVEGNTAIKPRKRDVEKVVIDLKEFLNTFRTPYVLIGDDTFTADRNRVIAMCNELKEIRKERDFIWFAEGRVNVLSKNMDLIPTMVESGLYKLQIGVESGSQSILDNYNKGISLQQIEDVVKECSKYPSMVIHGNFILGNPGENEATFIETIEFAKHLIDISNFKMDISCGYLVPFPGTPIYENPTQFGIEILNENFEETGAAFLKPICRPVNLSIEYLNNMYTVFISEISKYYKREIWRLPKSYIDKKIKFDQKYGGQNSGVYTINLSNTYYKILALKKYYDLYFSAGTVKKTNPHNNIDKISRLYPLRLWDINYSQQSKSYSFNSLSGKSIKISKKDVYLWERATGKSSIREIIEDDKSPFIYSPQTIISTYNFYRSLENEYALVFRDF